MASKKKILVLVLPFLAILTILIVFFVHDCGYQPIFSDDVKSCQCNGAIITYGEPTLPEEDTGHGSMCIGLLIKDD